MQAAQQYGPENSERFIQYVQQEPMAAAQLRAPVYEDKVVDFLFEKTDVTDRDVSREEIEAAVESEDGFPTGTQRHHPGTQQPSQQTEWKHTGMARGVTVRGDIGRTQ